MRCALTSDETRVIAAGACMQWKPTSHRVSLISLIEGTLARAALCKSLNTNPSTFPDHVTMMSHDGHIVIDEAKMTAQVLWVMRGKAGLYECLGWITTKRVKDRGTLMSGNRRSLTVEHLTEADRLYDLEKTK